MTEYFVRFANDLNPNPKSGVQWPTYDSIARQSLSFQDGEPALAVVGDADRLDAIQQVLALSLRFPF